MKKQINTDWSIVFFKTSDLAIKVNAEEGFNGYRKVWFDMDLGKKSEKELREFFKENGHDLFEIHPDNKTLKSAKKMNFLYNMQGKYNFGICDDLRD